MRRGGGSSVAAALVALCVIASCGSGRAAPAAQAGTRPVNATGSTPVPRMGAMTPRDANRITTRERAAIETLGRSTAGAPHSLHSHGHSASERHLELPLLTGDAAVFADQWLTAASSTARLDTIEEVTALGYVRASAPIGGIGSHWVLWSQIAEPFDPGRPSMLLFDERKQPAALVGYSYWLQAPVEPVGFAGNNDQWHQHTGLCVVNGWADREEATGPAECAGTFLAGGDLWMLHAWVVPRYPSRLGRFSTINPMLCPPAVGTPDDMRCRA